MEKKGLSEIVGYVLLVVMAIALALLVYAWMKGLLWNNPKECPAGVSLIIADYACNQDLNNITITLKNNGLFSINGFIARISNEPGKLATKPLLNGVPLGGEATGEFFFNETGLLPNIEFVNSFSYDMYSQISDLEITPLKDVDGERILCDKSIIKQQLENCR